MGHWNLQLVIVCVVTTLGVVKLDSSQYYDVERIVFDNIFQQNHYDKRTAPRSKDGGAVVVNHTISAVRAELDVNTQLLALTIWETFLWTDDRLAFSDVDVGNSVDTDHLYMYVSPSEVWIPDVVAYNTLSQEPVHKYARVGFASDGHCAYIPNLNMQTFCAVDDHVQAGDRVNCSILFGSWMYDSSRLYLEQTPLVFDGSSYTAKSRDWTIEAMHVRTENRKYSCCPGTYREQMYDLELKRTNHI